MSKKPPINSLGLFYDEFDNAHGSILIKFTREWFKELLKIGYYVDEVNELWFDDPEGGLKYNNWVDVYGEGIWDMTQKETDRLAEDIVRDFSHLTRRSHQKAIPRSFLRYDEARKCLLIYLYMRDRVECDYVLVFRRREQHDKNL